MDSLNVVLERSKKEYTPEEKECLCAEKNKIYLGFLTEMTPKDVSQDTRDTLGELRRRGIKIAIGSSSKNTHFVLHQIGLEGVFDAIADGNEIIHAKPDPEIFLLAASKIGQSPDSCLVIEDAEAGILAANRGGFHSVGISWAAASPNKEYAIQRLSDLLPLLG